MATDPAKRGVDGNVLGFYKNGNGLLERSMHVKMIVGKHGDGELLC